MTVNVITVQQLIQIIGFFSTPVPSHTLLGVKAESQIFANSEKITHSQDARKHFDVTYVKDTVPRKELVPFRG